MKTHTNDFKNEIKKFGRQLDSKITYTINNEEIELGSDELNSITPHYKSDILKSVMKELEVDSNVEIPIGTVINYQFGVLVNGEFEYLDFGNYIVKEIEKKEDTRSWLIKCCDKMLYAMVDYEALNITYPITIRNYINAIATHLGLTFANNNEEFVNYDKTISNELYLDSNGNSLNYTFRDVLDELAEVTASMIIINEDDELELKYIQNDVYTEDTKTGNPITTEEALANKLLDFEIEGNSYQNSRILPEGYTQVEYLESTDTTHNTNYIETGIYPTNNTSIEVEFEFNQQSMSYSRVFGSSNLFRNEFSDNSKGLWNYYGTQTRQLYESIYTNTKYKIKQEKNKTYINGNLFYTFQTETFTDTNVLRLFSATTGNRDSKIKMYYAKIWENNVLVRYYIPCYRNSDNEPGMYDLVNNVFYTNKGTGSFTYGSIASIPNPDYPQNIEVVTGNCNLKITGKNLFNKSNVQLKTGASFNGTENHVVTNTTSNNQTYAVVKAKPNSKIYFSHNNDNYTIEYYIACLKNTTTEAGYVNGWLTNGSYITTTDNTQYLGIVIRVKENNVTLTSTQELINDCNIQVEYDAVTSYKPYQSQNYEINLGNLEFCRIEDYKDILFKNTSKSEYYNSNLIENAWYIEKNIGKVVLNGSEGWYSSGKAIYTTLQNVNCLSNRNDDVNSGNIDYVMSNYFSINGLGVIYNNGETGITLFYMVNNPSEIRLAFGMGNISVNDFKTWLGTHNTTVYYQYKTPTYTPITNTTLINQLENIELFEGINHISFESNIDTNISITYKTKNIIENEAINEEYLKDINVNFGEKFGAINTVVFSRSGGADKIAKSIPENLSDENKIPIEIADNQILNFNNRDEFINGILNQLYGLEYYLNDYVSTGITYLDVGDRYYVHVDNKSYSCVMFNDEINITQGLEENIYTEISNKSETNYKKTDKTDRRINQAYIIVDKQNQEIEALTSRVSEINSEVNNNYQEMINKFSTIDESINQIDSIETRVTQLQTDTYTKTEVQQIANGTGVDGVKVTAVISTSGTFDENGLTIEKTNAKTKGNFNETGITVTDATGYVNEELLFAGYDNNLNETIVRTKNINVSKYLTIGKNSRLEDYEDGTGVFYVGR